LPTAPESQQHQQALVVEPRHPSARLHLPARLDALRPSPGLLPPCRPALPGSTAVPVSNHLLSPPDLTDQARHPGHQRQHATPGPTRMDCLPTCVAFCCVSLGPPVARPLPPQPRAEAAWPLSALWPGYAPGGIAPVQPQLARSGLAPAHRVLVVSPVHIEVIAEAARHHRAVPCARNPELASYETHSPPWKDTLNLPAVSWHHVTPAQPSTRTASR